MLKLKSSGSPSEKKSHFRKRRKKYYTQDVLDFIDDFKESVKLRKKIMGFTSRDLSEMTGISKSVIEKLLTERMDMSLGHAYSLAVALSMPIYPKVEGCE